MGNVCVIASPPAARGHRARAATDHWLLAAYPVPTCPGEAREIEQHAAADGAELIVRRQRRVAAAAEADELGGRDCVNCWPAAQPRLLPRDAVALGALHDAHAARVRARIFSPHGREEEATGDGSVVALVCPSYNAHVAVCKRLGEGGALWA